MNKRMILILFAGMFLVLSCAAVNRMVADTPTNQADDEDIVYLVGGQPRTLDPAITHSGAGGPVGSIFSGLVTLDTTLQVQPELADGWDVGPAAGSAGIQPGTVYTFYLRSDAVFHDGRPVTAQDVIYSWERAADPETGSDTAQTYLGDIVGVREMLAGESEHISGLRAVDDHTLEVQIDAPKVYFLSKLTYPAAFVVDRHNVTDDDWEKHPNGTGPFKLAEWRDDEILVLERHERYHRDLPAVDQVVYLMGAGIPLSMYEKDEIHLVGVGGSTLERVQDPNNPLFPDLRLGVNMCTSYIGFNTAEPPFDDPRVRQAFSYALDREKVVDGLNRGNALPALGPLPPGMPGYTGDLVAYDYDPEKARDLLAEAGYPDPADFPIVTYTTSGYGRVNSFVTAIITMWQDSLGVTIEPVLLDPFNYLDELYAGNLGNIYGSGWCADYPDPENFLDILYHSQSPQNLGRYNNPSVNALLEEARVEPAVARRMELYHDIEQQIVSDAPVVFLTHSLSAMLVKPELDNYVLTPIGVPQWHNVTLDN